MVKSKTNPNYMFYDEHIRMQMLEEKNIEGRMHDAFVNREFIIEYQPKVDAKNGNIVSAEALVRWKLTDNTVIPPDRFIPIFEKKFMIDRLDQYVFEEVCRWLRRMLDKGKKVLPIAVNVSRLQFYNVNFIKRYVEIREQYKIPYDLLEIEITESIVFDNTGMLENIIRSLKQNHFRCSIDDFGKGYSSLSMLKQLPVDYLKIDALFFKEGVDKKRDLALVNGIIDMVHNLQMKTVAEGIESKQQVRLLKEIGCDYIQGYVFYRPLSQHDFEAILSK